MKEIIAKLQDQFALDADVARAIASRIATEQIKARTKTMIDVLVKDTGTDREYVISMMKSVL